MLRRKLLLVLGPLVMLLVIVSVVSVLLLQDVLRRLDHQGNEAWAVVDQLGKLSNTMSRVEIELYAIQLGQERHLDKLIDAFDELRRQYAAVGQRYVVHEGEADGIFQRVGKHVNAFEREVGELGTAQDPARAMEKNRKALLIAVGIRQDLVDLNRLAAGHGQREQASLASRFKWLVLGMSVIFLLLINASVLVFMRAAGMILGPVDKLVNASRELAKEHFHHRVEMDAGDEFAELGAAYNHLAEQLQANEAKRLETLGMAATALNHELNNAMGLIELQLKLLQRRASDHEAVEKCLRRIGEAIERMTRTVESLKHVRRIVLTDYVRGTKMLDLERSTQIEPPVEQGA